MAGAHPFLIQNNQLCLAFKPILPRWLFNEDKTISYTFLGRTTVIYHNPAGRDTFDPESIIRRIILHPVERSQIELTGGVIRSPFAGQVREGKIKQIDVHFA